jgi:integrase
MAKGIYKRGNIFWICYAGLDGRTVFESSGSRKFKDAEAILTQRKNEIREGKNPENKRIDTKTSFEQLAERYSEWMKGRHRSAESKQYRINQLLAHFGNIRINRFNTLIVEQHQTDLINSKLAPSSVNKNISILKAMFAKAVEWKLVDKEILNNILMVKQLTENNMRLRYLNIEEIPVLIDFCEKHLKPIVITALNTGMRRGEILSLEWDKHIDLRQGFINLDKTKNDERRSIPINATLKNVLQSIPRRMDIPYVFFDPATGQRYKGIKHSFKTALKKAKIKDFHFHDLRHTFASHLVMSGVDLTTVAKLLGHKSLKMTLRYAHLAPQHLAKAVNVLDATFNPKPTLQLLDSETKKDLAAVS